MQIQRVTSSQYENFNNKNSINPNFTSIKSVKCEGLYKKYPEFAYKLTYIDDNHIEQLQLIPLCRECHEREHNRLHEPPPPLTAERS